MLKTNSHEITEISLKRSLLFIFLTIGVALVVYYVPSYTLLEQLMADQSAAILKGIGLDATVSTNGHQVLLDEFWVARECTGIQVIAVFTGLLAALPTAKWKDKIVPWGVLYGLLHVTNVFRIVLEVWLVRRNILPWSLAHYPLSSVIAIIGVIVLVVVTDRLLPSFGDYLIGIGRGLQRGFQRILRH